MRAVAIGRTGPPESLQVVDFPVPEAGPGRILIRVHRAGVNFAEILARQGIYPDAPKPPFVPGYEVSGTVEAVGADGGGFRPGDRVAAFTRFGGYAEYAVSDVRFVVPLGKTVGFAAAAAVPVNYATAHYCLFHTGMLEPGDRVLVHAAAGGVGLAAVRMAREAGAVVFGTAGSPEKVRFLRERGVDHPIDYRERDFVEEVWRVTGGEGVDVILDSIGGPMIARDLQVLRPGGRIVSLGLAVAAGKSRPAMLKELLAFPRLQPIKLLESSRAFVGVNILRIFDTRPALGAALLRRAFDYIEGEREKPLIAAEFPLERAWEAHRLLEERTSVGKILLAVRD